MNCPTSCGAIIIETVGIGARRGTGLGGAMANAIAWGKVGAVVAALALTYGVAMSIALVVYVYRFRGRRMTRR